MTPGVAVTRRGMGITIAVTAAIVGVVYGYDTGSIRSESGAARAVIELGVGEERAVPATKTVTAQFVVFAQIAQALGAAPFSREELEAVPVWVQQVLDDPEPAQAAAEALIDATHLIVVARGF